MDPRKGQEYTEKEAVAMVRSFLNFYNFHFFFFFAENSFKGATTLSVTTLRIMALNIVITLRKTFHLFTTMLIVVKQSVIDSNCCNAE